MDQRNFGRGQNQRQPLAGGRRHQGRKQEIHQQKHQICLPLLRRHHSGNAGGQCNLWGLRRALLMTNPFQSTLPVWGATPVASIVDMMAEFQSTLPVWGATRGPVCCAESNHFNPRSPCGERRGNGRETDGQEEFQSTLPVWGATSSAGGRSRVSQDFNPRSPCGKRRQRPCLSILWLQFQSTLPVWGAT